MAKIFWTAGEKRDIAERSFAIRMDSESEGSDLDCIREAMHQVIKPDRFRELRTIDHVSPWLRERWTDLLALRKEQAVNGKLPEFPQAIKQPLIQEKLFSIKDVTTSALWAELGVRIQSMMDGDDVRRIVRDELNRSLERRLPGLLPPDDVDIPQEQPKTEARKHKLKIAVIGLKPEQQGLIQQQYKDDVSFLFSEKSASLPKIKNMARHCDWVVQMIRFSDQVKGANHVENFHMCPGLLTQLRDFINRRLLVDKQEA